MNDAVDRVLMEREGMDRGFPAGVILSLTGHLLLVGVPLLAAVLGPKQPILRVQEGFAVALPAGGGGSPAAEVPAPAAPAPPPKAEPPPKVVRPPKEPPKKGLPELDAKRLKKSKPERSPQPARAAGAPGGTGTTQTIGIGIGAAGPGVPGGTDILGDWYMAGVVQKVWMIWSQQIQAGHKQPVVIELTILADGSVTDVTVVESSGAALLDLAAQRAVYSAAPFGPLPKTYETDRFKIRFRFQPAS